MLLEFIDLFLQVLQSPLILPDKGQDRYLSGRRDLVPKFRGMGGCEFMQLTCKPSRQRAR